MTTDDATTPPDRDRAPGVPDLSGYSEDQLRGLLNAELARRASAEQVDAPLAPSMGRFTRRDGLLGWLESVARRQLLFGRGSIGVAGDTITLHGWQRTWLGVPVQRAVSISPERVRNVVRLGGRVYMEIAGRWWFARKLVFEPDAAGGGEALLAKLPATKTASFAATREGLLKFEEALRTHCPVPWVTPALVLLNIGAFVALVVAATTAVAPAQSPVLLRYANLPSIVLDGEWWRLVTALFVHAGLLHLALNMWALWSIGRLTERLFGSARYLCVYGLAGLVAGLASIAWDPERWSVGASGAIFGVFGAFIAYLAAPAEPVPRAIVRAHWVPTLLFLAFNLIGGALQSEVDNAAHVGGLLGGLALGIAWVPRRSRLGRYAQLAAAACLVLVTATALAASRVFERQPALAESFATSHPWYATGESRNLAAWQRLAGSAAAGAISEAQLADGFRDEILPFWQEAQPRLRIAVPGETERQRDYRLEVSGYAGLRQEWATAVAAAADGDEGAGQSAADLMQRVTKRVARIERLALLSRLENSGSGLVRSSPVVAIKAALNRRNSDCVRSPRAESEVADTDSRTDVPYLNDAAACEAQRLFVAGSYAELEALFAEAGTDADFAGDISMAPLRAGLVTLFEAGSDGIEANLRRLLDWRRAVPQSRLVLPLQAELFSAWAWQARGTGTSRQVSQQAWQAYGYRTEMALAALEADSEAPLSPLWYQAWFGISIDTAEPRDVLAKLVEAQALYADYDGFYRGVLRALLPRWGGTHAAVMDFIERQASSAPPAEQDERYAQLVWLYADMEIAWSNVIETIRAGERTQLRRGLIALRERYPESDYLLNVFARLACSADWELDYRELRPLVEARHSATAWTRQATLEACDKKFPARP